MNVLLHTPIFIFEKKNFFQVIILLKLKLGPIWNLSFKNPQKKCVIILSLNVNCRFNLNYDKPYSTYI